MGSASREALARTAKLLEGPIAANVGLQLLEVAQHASEQPQLAAALSDPAASESAKAALVAKAFGGITQGARTVLTEAAVNRWSSQQEFVSGIEELGIRATAATSVALDDELLQVAALVDSNHELELTLGSKLVNPARKAEVLQKLLGGKVSDATAAVATHLVSYPRGRRFSTSLRDAARVAADQLGNTLAQVTTAAPLDATRAERLRQALSKIAGRSVKITTSTDPSLVGGIRVQIADEVIDGSVRTRLEDLRLQLAG